MSDPSRWRDPQPNKDDISLEETEALPVAAPEPGYYQSPVDISFLETAILPRVSLQGLESPWASSARLPIPRSKGVDVSLLPTQIQIPIVGRSAPFSEQLSTLALAKAALSLVGREMCLKVVVLAATVALARLLAPAEFGVFVVLSFFNAFLVTFGSFGLAASVVQRREAPTRPELAALLTMQLVLGALVVGLAVASAPILVDTYNLGPDGIWLIVTMGISFFLASAGAIPMALLERRLAFGRVAWIEVVAGIAVQGLAVALAFNGFGVWSLVAATLVGAALTMLMGYLMSGWLPSLSFRWRRVLPMAGYGLRYQAVNILALIKDARAPIFVAAILGAQAVGYIDWASTLAFYPLILVAIIGRVTFPAYSRLAHDSARLKSTIEGTLRIQAYAIFPAVAALAALAPYIALVGFTAKWLPGVPLLYLLLASTLVASVNSTLAAALNALGKPQVVLRFMFIWLVLSWVLAVIFVLWLDTLGYAIADAIVASTVVMVVRVFKRHQPIDVLRNITLPLLAAALAGAGVYALSLWQVPLGAPLLGAEIVGVFVIFVLIEITIDPHFRHDARSISRLLLGHERRAGVSLEPSGLQSER